MLQFSSCALVTLSTGYTHTNLHEKPFSVNILTLSFFSVYILVDQAISSHSSAYNLNSVFDFAVHSDHPSEYTEAIKRALNVSEKDWERAGEKTISFAFSATSHKLSAVSNK